MKNLPRRSVNSVIVGLFLLVSTLFYYFIPVTKAADFGASGSFVFLDRITASTATGGTVCAKPVTTATEADVQIVFPTGYTVSTTLTNWAVATTNIPTSILGSTPVAWPGIAQATAATGQTVTFPSTDLTVGTYYCFRFTNTAALTTPAATSGSVNVGTITTRTLTPTTIDTASFGMAIVASGSDQVSISATVPATFSFSLSATSIALGTLSTSAVTSGNVTLTISTNGKNGWNAWVKSANAALSSTNSGGSISSSGTYPTVTDISASSGYVLDADATTGAPSIAAGYNGTDTNSGGKLDTYFQHLAYKTSAVSGNVVTINVRAKAAATTPYGTDYADTLTVVASGEF